MQIVSAAAINSIMSKSMVLGHRANVNLPAGVYDDVTASAKSLSITNQINSDSPAGSRMQPGYTSRTATIVLNGTVDKSNSSRTAAWLFSDYPIKDSTGAASPMYRKHALYADVTIDIGIYIPGIKLPGDPSVVWIRKFTGMVDTYGTNARTGDVTISCIDLRNNLRSTVNTPPVVIADPYNTGLTNEFALDWVLRAASAGRPHYVSAWPQTRSKAILSVGMHASVYPEVGSLNTTYSRGNPVFAVGPFGSGLITMDSSTAYNLQAAVYDIAPTADTIHMEFLFSNIGSDGLDIRAGTYTSFGGLHFLTGGPLLHADSTGLQFNFPGNGVTLTTPVDNGVHRARVQATFSSGPGTWAGEIALDSFSADGTTFTTVRQAFTGLTGLTIAGLVLGQVSVPVYAGSTAIIAGAQITTETGTLLVDDNWTPTAIYDQSLNPLLVIPPISGDPWQAVQDMASSEIAVAEFNDYGILRYHNRKSLSSGASVRDITSMQGLSDAASSKSASSIRSRVSCSYTPWTFKAQDILWTIDHIFSISAGQTETFTIDLKDTIAGTLDTTVTLAPNGTYPSPPALSLFRASSDKDGNTVHPGGLVFNIHTTSANKISVSIKNTSASKAYLVSPYTYLDVLPGTVAFQIAGQPVVANDTISVEQQWPPVEADGSGGAASNLVGDVRYDFPDNQWIQYRDVAQLLVADAIGDLSSPKPVFSDMAIHPDPRLAICDRVHIIDGVVSGIDEYALIWGFTLSLAKGAVTMSISASAVARPGNWILGVPGRSELGVTTWI